ncbi:hypothetical protein KIN20_021409 [Parelaphostrongylus tenuis]|uniref:Uncharacterized protein n=1 Tax=Parelaphostrongylus tenuis TaxID=148309 RepID=A0AAD5N572_PARTN|nr:hypothetical protein KIN20_021409 [Parelaphostrongylus tenuis]
MSFKAFRFYPAVVTKLEDYPKHCMKMDKYGKYFNQAGYVPVKWAGCDNLFQMLPARCVVPMFPGLYELMGKRLEEIPYRRGLSYYNS